MHKMILPLLWLLLAAARVYAHPELLAQGPHFPRPKYTDYAKMARWLVHENEWGVVSTSSKHLQGTPFGNAVSYADGPRGEPTGRLLFYLTIMDATAQDLEDSSQASLTISEAQLPGRCRGVDPEDPTCAKLTISGSLEKVPKKGLEEAQRLLFSRHPAMPDWPRGHQFAIYELHIATVRLLDWYGGPHDLTPQDYFAAELDQGSSVAGRDAAGRAVDA